MGVGLPVQSVVMTAASASEASSHTVVAVCAGRARWHTVGGKRLRTAFVKDPLPSGAHVSRLGVEGDEHVYDQHGGPDMALLVYSIDHYDYWHGVGLELPASSAFGENLTVTGLTEIHVCIGDVVRAGSVVMQITQPRHPCHKIAAIRQMKDLTDRVRRTGYTGYLMRVVEEGHVAPGDEITVIEHDGHGITIAEAARVLYADRHDHEAARRLLLVDGLAASARRSLEERLGMRGQLTLDIDTDEGRRGRPDGPTGLVRPVPGNADGGEPGTEVSTDG